MKVSKAITNFMDFQKMNSGKNTVKNYSLFLNKFKIRFDNQEIETITSDEILSSLDRKQRRSKTNH